ncbi:MAG: GAF domain-containing protein [Anaerolineae bacterium]|nr:GAF domain-containing protein [Anaerolineae bacterium]
MHSAQAQNSSNPEENRPSTRRQAANPFRKVAIATPETVQWLSLTLGGTFAIVSLAAVWELAGNARTLQILVAGVSCILFLLNGLTIQSRAASGQALRNTSLVSAGLAVLASTLLMALSGEPRHTLTLILSLSSLAVLFASLHGLLVFVPAALLLWGIAAAIHGFGVEWQFYGLLLLGAAAFTFGLNFALSKERRRRFRPASFQASGPDTNQQAIAVLSEAAHVLASVVDLKSGLEQVLEQLTSVVACDIAVVFLVDNNTLRIRAQEGLPAYMTVDVTVPLASDALASRVFLSRHPIIIENTADQPYVMPGQKMEAPRSWIGVPLLTHDEAIGVLMVASHKRQAFGANDIRWVKAFGDYTAAAVRNLRLTDRTQRTVRRLSFLYEAARTLTVTLDTDRVLQQLMSLTRKYFQPAAVSVAITEADGSTTFRAASGEVSDQMVGLHLPRGKGIVGWVAEHAEAAWVPNVAQDRRFFQNVDQDTGFTTQAIYAAPVIQDKRAVAVIEMVNPARDMELMETREVMTALAALAAPAIQNAVLFEQVCQAEERYQRLFDLNMDPIVILDADGRLLDFNREAQLLLGFPETCLQESCLNKLNIIPGALQDYEHQLETERIITWETTLQDAQGKLRTLKAHLTQLEHYEPQKAYQWLAHDITERVALERMREQLTNMIVHDLRSPLNSIINSLELISTAWEQKDITMPIDQLLHISLRSAQRMERLIKNILDTARLRIGDRKLALSFIDTQALIDEVEEISRPLLTHRNQTFESSIPANLPGLKGDIDLLRRVLTNLLDNAIKFTPTGGKVSIQVEEKEDLLRFAIHDNGPGIAPEEHDHIFELYARGSGSANTRGTGVGLAFCKLAVEAHGGRIWVESELGRGAHFIFTLPKSPPNDDLHF